MGDEKKGTAALESWARKITDGYRGVAIRNMTTSWRNGLAFCAIIHRFHPELIDYDSLDADDIIGNCTLAFDIAESKLGIPSLLDPEDMLNMEVPDRLSILTYLAQYHNYFKSVRSKSAGADENLFPNGSLPRPQKGMKRELNSDDILEETRDRGPKRSVLLSSANVCTVCGNPVFISERVNFAKKLYHSSCFRCSSCNSNLNPHTAEITASGQLFCLDNACHKQFQQINRGRFFSPGSSSTNTANVLSTKKENPASVQSNNCMPVSIPPASEPQIQQVSTLGVEQKENERTGNIGEDNRSPLNRLDPVRRSRIQIPAAFLFGQNIPSSTDGTTTTSTVSSVIKQEPPKEESVEIKQEGESSSTDTRKEETDSALRVIESVRVSPTSETTEEEVVACSEAAPAPAPPTSTPPDDIIMEDEQLPSDRLHVEEVPAPPHPSTADTVDGADKSVKSMSFSSVVEVTNVEPPSVPESSSGSETSDVEATKEVEPVEDSSEENLIREESESKEKVGILDEVRSDEEISRNLGEGEDISSKSEVESEIKEEANPLIPTTDDTRNRGEAPEPQNPFEDDEDVEESVPQETPKSPASSRKNALEFLKETISKAESQSGVTNSVNGDDETSRKTPPEVGTPPEINVEEETSSHNESGVGDSLESDPRSDTESVNLSIGTQNSNKADEEVASTHEKEEEALSSENSSESRITQKEVDVLKKPQPIPRRSRSPNTTSLDSNHDQRNGKSPTPSPRKRVSSTKEMWKNKDYYPPELNPFEESEDNFTLQPSDILVMKNTRSQERLPPLNPFEEDDDEEEPQEKPLAKQPPPRPAPPVTLRPPKSPSASVRSIDSVTGSVRARSRKTHHAPLPPSMVQNGHSPPQPVSPSKRPAPPPPKPRVVSATPTALVAPRPPPSPSPEKKLIPASPDLLKGLKNQTNRATAHHYRKKRRAPPPKRHVTPLPEDTIKTELADLAIKEKEFERQGISLEANIRNLMSQEDDSLDEQIEEMVVQLWNIVNEKNDILRRQTELDYLRRGHRLEEMQAEIEFQLRMLMETPADQRQEDQEDAEQQLLQDLIKIVDERNEVVDWLDYHRQLDREEDMHVSQSLTSFSSVSRASTPTPTPPPPPHNNHHVVLPIKSETVVEEDSLNKSKTNAKNNKEGKKKDKFKIQSLFTKKKGKKSKKKDEDKDNDESVKVT